MKTRTVVLALAVGAVIAGGVFVATHWPRLPERTTPSTTTYVPITGQPTSVPDVGCLAPIVAELRKRPNWSLRIDDMRWTDYTSGDDDPRHAFITLDANGATWSDAELTMQTLPLTSEDVTHVIAAFDLGCKRPDPDESEGRYEGRYIGIAYERNAKRAATLDYKSPACLRIGEIFEELRGRYIANRAGAAKQFVIKLAGVWRAGADGEWEPKSLVIDSAQMENDEERVTTVDWAMSQPTQLPKGKQVATGTFTLDGKVRPIAVDLQKAMDFRERGSRLGYRGTEDLRMWIIVNRPQ